MKTTKRFRKFLVWLNTLDNNQSFVRTPKKCIISEYYKSIYPNHFIELGNTENMKGEVKEVTIYTCKNHDFLNEKEINLSPTEVQIYNGVHKILLRNYTVGEVKEAINLVIQK